MPSRDNRWLDAIFPPNADRTVPWGEVGQSVALYRPVGLQELRLIAQSGYRAFPSRLPDQPIFYPVLNLEYAEEIARDWNAPREPFAGFVTRFEVAGAHATRYDIQVVGSERLHQELWVPAEDLDEFNRHILGAIGVVAAYYSQGFVGEINPLTNLPLDLPVPPSPE